MDSRLHWIWLAQALGPGHRATSALLAQYTTASAIYAADPDELRRYGVSPACVQRLRDHSLDEAQEILDRTLKEGDWVLTPEDALYPMRLRRLEDLPAVLYCRGTMPSADNYPAIAVVGTRRSTPQGVRDAFAMAAGLAAGGMTVVSGGAVGIDAAAHEGALYADGRTVLVMACPLTERYPVENIDLRRRIVESGGTLISEYPPGRPFKCIYPVRNRLMVGLSCGVCMAETPTRSGARISARIARDNALDVYAMPGALVGHHNDGAHREIRGGAMLVTSAADIIEEYLSLYPDRLDVQAAQDMQRTLEKQETLPIAESRRREPRRSQPPESPATPPVAASPSAALPDSASADARGVYTALTDTPQAVDDIAQTCAMTIPQVLVALTELEMCGCAANSAGQRYYRL